MLNLAKLNFPGSIIAKQLKGLAFRRLKSYEEAIDVMSELKAAGHQDPETAGFSPQAGTAVIANRRLSEQLSSNRSAPAELTEQLPVRRAIEEVICKSSASARPRVSIGPDIRERHC